MGATVLAKQLVARNRGNPKDMFSNAISEEYGELSLNVVKTWATTE